ncbi:N-acetylmuramoyl-L-alanine amidase-like domain-containing protein [Xanthomonas arboricola]|uniref:N-acetylmuramoyl-L-alanine amidase-like domain-containing protein n=1 Tax=Xanthomonas arboricola TaxID=56448 RepID=UPI002804C89C|nr:N-acetylmuramoyl-L-alanine amidase-like domain-containing protein [Xanthomonas arboricola]
MPALIPFSPSGYPSCRGASNTEAYLRTGSLSAPVSNHRDQRADARSILSLSPNHLPGLPVVDRAVTYIPTEHIDGSVIRKLRTGDFIGIYTHLAGLDVTHVGFFVMTDTGPVLRNASSRKGKRKGRRLALHGIRGENAGNHRL